MNESSIRLPSFGGLESALLWLVVIAAAVALLYGWWLSARVLRRSAGPASMQQVAAAIQEGARAYLRRQFRTMSLFIVAITLALFFLYLPIYTNPTLAVGIALAFLMGCLASYGAGYVGMNLAVRGNVRTAYAATRSFKEALETAFQAGTVSGMFTVGLGLLGATIIFLLFRGDATRVLVGFGFGGSLVASFMRIGGGIYTKVADVGADLVGKVEVGIPEDDPRNAATIADNVGDNVGDCAGMAADVFESYEVTLVAAIILGAGALLDPQFRAGYAGAAAAFALKLVIFPLLVQAVGVFASLIGTWAVRAGGATEDPMAPITRGLWISAAAATAGFAVVNGLYLRDPRSGAADWRFFFALVTGLVLALFIKWLTDQFTASDKKAVTEMAYSTKTGPATFLLSGLGYGLESSVWAILAIGATILASFSIFQGDLALAGYGVALSGLGLLTMTGYILAMDTFGPIVDNANGIYEMSGIARAPSASGADAGYIVAQLDQAGNTTKALTKGFAIASAVLAATALFRSFVGQANLLASAATLQSTLAQGGAAAAAALDRIGIQVNLPLIFIGLLVGGAVPFLVSAFLIRAVGRSAFYIVEEVRRQFREIPGIMDGTGKPQYDRCVDIATLAAQRELASPAVVAISAPIMVGMALGAAPLGAFLAGAILTGQLMAVFQANTGGAWDNAKKKIEDGFLGGKGTEYHKAGVIGDTVGDPMKDTAGPALNPLIKVMNLVSILIAPVTIMPLSGAVRGAVVVIALALMAWAVAANRRSAFKTQDIQAAARMMPAPRAPEPLAPSGQPR